MLRRILILAAIVGTLVFGFTAFAVAANPPGSGQPSQSCEDTPTTPGQSSSARGSAFNPDGVSGGVYADGTESGRPNDTATSQYDTACFQQSSRP
jgi:hypothetical protein